MVNLDSLTFDLTDCSLREESPRHRIWMTAAGIAYNLQFYEGPPDWPFDLAEPDVAADFYRRQCLDREGVMLSMNVTRAAAGGEVLQGVFKYRSPVPRSMGMYYVGILWLPFKQCCFQINVEAMETGATGGREAAVMLLGTDKLSRPPEKEPIVVKSMEELLSRSRSEPVQSLESDDPRYDHSFPNHPLSQVRTRLRKALDTLTLGPSTHLLQPFRHGS